MSELMTECVGLHFRPREVKEFFNAECGPGTPLALEREPENAYDSNAIKVFAVDEQGAGWHIGYIPKTSNAVLAMLMDEGSAVNVTGRVFAISGKRIEIEVNWSEPEEEDDYSDIYEEGRYDTDD